MSRHRWTSDLHRQFVDTVEEPGRQREERQARLREIIRRQTKLHLRQYERLQKFVNDIRTPQRQEEEMDKSTTEVGELSSGTQEISCQSLYQSSRIGLNESGKDEKDTDNNDENMSLELTLGRK